MSKPKLFTIVGTRPEIIRLSRLIPKLDQAFDHTLIHTGQNYDPLLSDIFFSELGIRKPDFYLNANNASLGGVLATILVEVERLITEFKPLGLLVLGDTNSAISSVIAKRMQIVVYHWEAGNRSFDENVPEETNRKIVDHVAHFNIAYSKYAYQNLIKEGIQPNRLLLSGSPLKEVIDHYSDEINQSRVLETIGISPGSYFVASVHRQETVDSPERLRNVIASLYEVSKIWNIPVLVSTHPRTKARLQEIGLLESNKYLIFHEPFGYFDYMKLQINAKCVLSDSGTISEESAISNFPAVTLRESMERPEALAAGTIRMAGITSESLIQGIKWAITERSNTPPDDYLIQNSSDKVLELMLSTIETYELWSGVRKL